MQPEDIVSRVKSLFKARRACSYHRVDLHIHSPASHDYEGDQGVSPYDFILQFVERGFDLIAITDHNSGGYVDKAILARNQIASIEGKNITILPGVELHVSPGVHLLAVLPEGGSSAISDLLSRLGLQVNEHGDPTKLISQPIEEIRKIVHERRGLLIGAHCNSTKGVIEELRGQSRIAWIRAMDALEINSNMEAEKIEKTINYVTSDLKIAVPFTFGSDSHNCKWAGKGMWVKMAEPTLTSLFQFVFEPALRISRMEPPIPNHGRIVGFTSTHGIYPDERFRFSPYLNVLLGGRGAGKSAAIDLVRFAFEAEPRADDRNRDVFGNRIVGFLQSIGEVLVVVIGNDGETYAITRSGAYEKSSPRGEPTFTNSAQVYQVSNEELIPRDSRPLEILGVEFYGQGEAARLADRVDEQLRLIDENLDHSSAMTTIAQVEHQLKVDEQKLIDHEQHLEGLRVEAAARTKLEQRRDQLNSSLADPVFADRKRWDRERTWVQARQDWIQSTLASLPVSVKPPTNVTVDMQASSAKAVLEKIQEASKQFLDQARGDLGRSRDNLVQAESELQGYRAEWDAAFAVAEEKYRKRLTELGAANLAQAAAEQRRIDAKLTRIETVIEPEMRRFEFEISSLTTRRTQLLLELRAARTAIATSRQAFVDELNGRLDGNVKVDLSGMDKTLYFEALDTPLQGSRMQRREEQVWMVCESFAPPEIVEIIRTSAIGKLESVGITQSNASRLISAPTHEDLYRMERIDVPQLPSISIKREGETEYTDLSSLSVGEKCSAILSIALLSKGKPLVIDQPEDDLDHAFIIDSIVGGIRIAKSDRQILAATHNPNIPVLGDAEMVFRVARLPGKDICRIQNSGGLEIRQITMEVQGLEGGAEAFERRRRRYSGVS